jgi:hypothetical protein
LINGYPLSCNYSPVFRVLALYVELLENYKLSSKIHVQEENLNIKRLIDLIHKKLLQMNIIGIHEYTASHGLG